MLFAGTLLMLMLASALVLRSAVRAALEREFDASLRSSAEQVSRFFRIERSEYKTIEATLSHLASELVFEDRAMHVYRPDGKEFVAAAAAEGHRDPALLLPVRHARFPLDTTIAKGWTIEVAASAAGVAAVEMQIDQWILYGIPAMVLIAALVGWGLTGDTLRPVGLMASAAGRIAPGTGGRLPVNNASDELGRLGMQFNALLDRLEDALDQQRRFLADAAHELRTPLARLRGRVDLALMIADADATDGTSDVLRHVHDDVAGMAHLVDELLQLARADAGRDTLPAAVRRMYLDDLVSTDLRRWQAEARRIGVTMTCSTLQEASVHGDPVLLSRLMGVIVDNALRYSQRGGQVDIRVLQTDHAAVLEVEDNGIGITPEERARIFERFYRGDRARRHQREGSGLGLAIASWITQLHGGSIDLVGNPRGAGTIARIALPYDTGHSGRVTMGAG